MSRKQELESEIRDTDLFTLDRDKDYIAYKKKAMKLVETIYLYLSTFKKRDYKKYGLEITEVAMSCIKNFDATQGEFLNYFMHAWTMEYLHIQGDKLVDKSFGGVHITDSDTRLFRKYKTYAKRIGVSVDTEDFIKGAADFCGVSTDKIKEMLVMESSTVTDAYEINSDGEEFSILEMIADAKNIETSYVQLDNAKQILSVVNAEYKRLKAKDRDKALISKIFTLKLAESMLDQEALVEYFKSLDIYDDSIFKRVSVSGEKITIKEIASDLGTYAPRASKCWSCFNDLLLMALEPVVNEFGIKK